VFSWKQGWRCADCYIDCVVTLQWPYLSIYTPAMRVHVDRAQESISDFITQSWTNSNFLTNIILKKLIMDYASHHPFFLWSHRRTIIVMSRHGPVLSGKLLISGAFGKTPRLRCFLENSSSPYYTCLLLPISNCWWTLPKIRRRH
jgi:hypothetical protein